MSKLKEIIHAGFQQKDALEIAEHCASNQHELAVLLHLFFHSNSTTTHKCSWILNKLQQNHEELILSFTPQFITQMKAQPHNYSMIRNIVRMWQNMSLSKQYHGVVYNICFSYLESPSCPIAIRVFSMTILYEITEVEPDLKQELFVTIENILPNGSAGLKSRGYKILKKLYTEIKREA